MPLAHFTLATRDVAGTARFFREVFGWKDARKPGNIDRPAAWLAIGPAQEMHLVEVASFEASPFEAEFGRHMALEVPLAEFEALKARLRERGAPIWPPERPTPFQRFFFRDPNGYVFEVLETDHAE